MWVWILTDEEGQVLGVFATEELAEAELMTFGPNQRHLIGIRGYEVEDGK